VRETRAWGPKRRVGPREFCVSSHKRRARVVASLCCTLFLSPSLSDQLDSLNSLNLTHARQRPVPHSPPPTAPPRAPLPAATTRPPTAPAAQAAVRPANAPLI
jgi:hypothetical protein